MSECQWCHSDPCTCPHGWPEAPAPLNISEEDLRGVFGHKCDQPNCPVCHPDMSLTELAELYERAAYPTGQDDVTSRPQFTKASAGTLEITDGTSASSGTSRKDSQVCAKGKIMMYLFFWIVMEFALVIGAVQLILKKGGF